MRNLFRDILLELATRDDRVVLLLGDISVYLMRQLQERYPDRVYNVGICENTIISVAAGLAARGFIPFAHTITPFLTERSYEQIKLALAYNGFAANLVTCGASFDYAWDGATHHCYTDLEILRLVPGLEVMQPGNKKEFRELLLSRYDSSCTSYFRLAADEHSLDLPVEFGRGNVVFDRAADLTVVTAGPILQSVYEACSDLPVNLLYFHTLKPLDSELVGQYSTTRFLVVHDAHGLMEAVAATGLAGSLSSHVLPDEFLGYYGTPEWIREKLALDSQGIRCRIKKELKSIP